MSGLKGVQPPLPFGERTRDCSLGHAEKEFRIMLVNMIQILRKGMEAKVEKTQKVFTEDLQELKKKQTEMNNALEGIQSRITEV